MRASLIICLYLVLSGCKANRQPLEFVQVEQKEPHVLSLTKFNPKRFHALQDVNLSIQRDPFLLPTALLGAEAPILGCHKDAVANSSLKTYPLDQLRLAGVMTVRGEHAALIELPDGVLITRVQGEFIAAHSLITDVTVEAVEIREPVQNSKGCLSYRTRRLVMN
ncbi:pilus assembly protein PilP [Vibrio sp. Isolate23]|uniref:pilus assembly protein PilP n=1 Tax=Vibrio sp. Isolate23 TaxID=2908533 RepID=UPI001EFE6F07|nr:pilus assembly protein PilP [Vibrio sp. Isolate23]